MAFNPPVPQQDNNMEIRVAMLVSLTFQAVLIFTGQLRKRYTSPVLRFIIWSCYLLADWIADLALGLLLNSLGNIGGGGGISTTSSSVRYTLHTSTGLKHAPARASTGGNSNNSSPAIFAFWAPFLLLHLGGPDTITAYSLADNELWFRHLIGLLFELFAAAVVFFCSLKGNPMIHATVVMFVAGIIKYSERTYSLYSGCVNSFRDSILGEPNPGPNYPKLMTEFVTRANAGFEIEIVIADVDVAKETNSFIQRMSSMNMEARAYRFFNIFQCMFINGMLSQRLREMSLAYFMATDDDEALSNIVQCELNFVYDTLYTKVPVIYKKAGYMLRFVSSCCIVSSLVIFVQLDKRSILHVDICITYALLVGALVLDAVALTMLLFSNWTLIFLEESGPFSWLSRFIRRIKWKPRWSEMTSRINLINFCLRKTNCHDNSGCFVRTLRKVVDALPLRAMFDDLLFIRREPIGCVLPFLFATIKNTAHKTNKAGIMPSKVLGEGPLAETLMEKHEDIHQNINDSFDDCLLKWHIATDLCLHKDKKSDLDSDLDSVRNNKGISECLSEYMLYLLIKQQEMMSATVGFGLIRYRNTIAELSRYFEPCRRNPKSGDDARQMLQSLNTSMMDAIVDQNRMINLVPFKACVLAKRLIDFEGTHGKEEMWKGVAEVWAKMLMYAAARTQGREHLQHLDRGGELITVVWLFMGHCGLAGNVYEMIERDVPERMKLVIRSQ